MACYYLVISSTHLSNGHFRSIKGVFRGPLRASDGVESPDYAIKEKAIAKALEDLKANFYCELCDKQYHKHKEFDNHINSYDHAHKQRLKELKQREFARNVSSKSWKDERKQERALRRLHQLALVKQQGDSDKEKNSKLRVATRDQPQKKVILNGSDQPVPRHIPSQARTETPPSLDVPSKRSAPSSVPADRCSILFRHTPLTSQTPKGHRCPRQGVSFCFSRRAQLKLESCASVFNDGLDETSDLQKLQRRRTLQALWSRTPSAALGQDGHNLPNDPAVTDAPPETEQQPDQEEICANFCMTEPCRQGCSDMHDLEAERQPAGSEARSANQGQRLKPEGAHGESLERNSPWSPSPTAHTDGAESNVACGQERTHTDLHQDSQKGSEWNTVNTECPFLRTETAEGDLGTSHVIKNTDLNDATHSYLNVLSKDGTTLKWPGEIVQYTSDKPSVSYSCNPLSLKFRCAEVKEKSTGASETGACTVASLGDRPDTAENRIRDLPEDKLGILKPKRPKQRQRGRARRRKLDAVRRHAFSGCSQAPEFKGAPADVSRSEKRHSLKKRMRSMKDEVFNQSDAPAIKLKSIVVNSFSTMARQRLKRQRLPSAIRRTKSRAIPYVSVHCMARTGDNYRWCGNLCEDKWDAGATPHSDKSGSWGAVSDLSSDGEWPTRQWGRRSSSPGSAFSYPWRRGHSQPWSYVRKSSYGFPCYGYRQTAENPGRDTEYREHCWDYRDSKMCRERNYSEICSSPYFMKQKYIRKHKRPLEENRYRECHKLDTKRICFYRVYDSPEPQETERGYWQDRPISNSRRLKERDRQWSSPENSQDRVYVRSSPASRHSPASSSTTSISDLSGDCGSRVKPSYSKQNHTHRINLTWPGETSDRTKVSHSPSEDRNRSPTPLGVTRLETMQTNTKPVISEPSKRQEAEDTQPTPMKKESISPDKRLTGNRVRTLSLPLIGKLPSIKRGIKQAGVHKEKCTISSTLNGPLKVESQVASENTHKVTDGATQTERNDLRSSETCLLIPPEKSAELCVISDKKDSATAYENLVKTPEKISESPENQPSRCSTPPLTEQPITFTEEELDKYRLLQLQAQQHMQQQRIQEQHEIPRQPTPMDVPPINHLPVPPLEPSNHPLPAPCLQYAIFQPGTILPFSSSISSTSSSFATHHSHTAHPPLSQPHINPLPFPAAYFPAPSTAVLAAHPLHLVPAPSLHSARMHPHPTGLALHPLPHASLLPTVLAPAPVAAAAIAAASALQVHPLLHPLFHSQELQHHPGPAS